MAPSATKTADSPTRSGIITSKDGERHIPSSVRADGSVRKEIRVRPGYKPPEDVDTYKNKTAQSFKARYKGGVPGAEAVEKDSGSASANKNAKRREARRKAAANAQEGDEIPNGDEKSDTAFKEATKMVEEPVDPEAEQAKEARKLAKKLRQARELKDKKEKGDTLLPEQFDKVIKISELIRQLDKLGFDSNGEKKGADG